MDIWWMTWVHIHVNIKSHMKDYNVAMCKIVANEILYITLLHLTSNQILPNKYCKCRAYKFLKPNS